MAGLAVERGVTRLGLESPERATSPGLGLIDLPDELLLKILSQLDIYQLSASVAPVCRRLRKV